MPDQDSTEQRALPRGAPAATPKGLRPLKETPLVAQVAALSAQGMTPTEITKAINGHRSSVSGIVNHPDFPAIRDRYQEVGLSQRLAQINRVLIEFGQAHLEAIAAMRELLEAKFEDGSPNVGARLQAARLLFGARGAAAYFGALPSEEQPTAKQGAIVHLHFGEKEMEIDAISLDDGDFEEEPDDQDR